MHCYQALSWIKVDHSDQEVEPRRHTPASLGTAQLSITLFLEDHIPPLRLLFGLHELYCTEVLVSVDNRKESFTKFLDLQSDPD